jgi:hypothetical protein
LGDPRHRPSDEELATGKHINPTGNPDYFTTAYFHHPDEIRAEFIDAGLTSRERSAWKDQDGSSGNGGTKRTIGRASCLPPAGLNRSQR